MILTLGDSFTYGEELDDLTLAWPYLLGHEFEHSVRNLGKPGGSNRRMFRLAIEETCKQSYDLVIVAWTDPSRIELFRSDEFHCILPGGRALDPIDQWRNDFYKYGYSDWAAHLTWYVDMVALQHYFKSIGQQYLFCTLGEVNRYHSYYEKTRHVLDKLDLTYMTTWPLGGFLSWQGDCPKGPGGHPLELGHRRIADKLAEYIRELKLL